MEEFGTVVAVIVGILWYVLPLVLKGLASQKEKQRRPVVAPRAAPSRLDIHALARALEHAQQLSDALADKITALRVRVGTAIGPAKILGEVLEQLSEEQNAVRSAIEQDARSAEAGVFPTDLPSRFEELKWLDYRLGAVEYMLDMRSSPVSGEMMADADAIAAAHLEPIVSFCQRRDIAFPRRRPLCVPAAPGQEAVFFGLFPDDFPVVFVPQDFGDDLLRWPSVSHEVGHVIWRELPGFAAEVRQVNGLRVDPTIPSNPRDVNLRKAYGAWLEELFCDFFAALQLGPPALRGMMNLFQSVPDKHLVWATVAEDGNHYEQHPPPHLRVVLTAHALWVMGYDVEAKELMRAWTAKVGESATYGFPALSSPPFGMPAETVEAYGRELVERLYGSQLRSIDSFPLPSIPGLAMTPGLWAHVQSEVEALANGDTHNDDPRVVISAAIEARATSRGSSQRLARLVTRAIIGINEQPRRHLDEVPESVSQESSSELLEAIVLYEVLKRRPQMPRRPLSRVARL